MDLSIATTNVEGTDASWLRSNHGTGSAIPGTLDVSKLTANTDYDANGVIPSGLAVSLNTTSGLYEPFDDAAVDFHNVLDGFVLTEQQLSRNFAGVTTTQVQFPLLKHGIIVVANLPKAPTITTSTATTGEFVLIEGA